MQNLPDPARSGNPIGNDQNNAPVGPTSIPAQGLHKEQEPWPQGEAVAMTELGHEVDISPELAQAGVMARRERVEVPPDLQQLGVTSYSPAATVMPTTTIQLPLTDEQIEVGLHAQIVSSLRWLAEWCARRLKQLHVHLKTVGGKVVRENG